MLRIILLATFVSTVLSAADNNYDIAGVPYTAAIVGGPDVCCGANIRPMFIVTTATCVQGKSPGALKVHVGANKYDEGIVYAVAKLFVHPDFVKATLDFNCGLIKLTKALIMIENKVEQIFMANDPPGDFYIHTLSGYATPKKFNHIQRGVINTNPTAECTTEYPDSTVNMWCGKPDNANPDDGTCMAEIGGPAVAFDRLYGVLSHRKGCKSVAVFTTIGKVKPWIETIFASDGKSAVLDYEEP